MTNTTLDVTIGNNKIEIEMDSKVWTEIFNEDAENVVEELQMWLDMKTTTKFIVKHNNETGYDLIDGETGELLKFDY